MSNTTQFEVPKKYKNSFPNEKAREIGDKLNEIVKIIQSENQNINSIFGDRYQISYYDNGFEASLRIYFKL